MHKSVLFVGTTNDEWSRFAEILFNARAIVRGGCWRAFSRGVALGRFPPAAAPVVPRAVAELGRRGIALDHYRCPKSATPFDFDFADRIIAMDEPLLRAVIDERFAAWRGDVAYWRTGDVPSSSYHDIDRSVDLLIDELSRDGAHEIEPRGQLEIHHGSTERFQGHLARFAISSPLRHVVQTRD